MSVDKKVAVEPHVLNIPKEEMSEKTLLSLADKGKSWIKHDPFRMVDGNSNIV